MGSRNRLGLTVAAMLLAAACGGDGSSGDAGGGDDGSADADGEDGGEVSCASDEDCDDGDFCNGAETCVDEVCRAAASSPCDDGIECTVDSCDEAGDECAHAAPDEDGDGHADAACRDLSGSPLGDDCDDADSNRFPGNTETCDGEGHDEDCDAETFAGPSDGDKDGDGHISSLCCNDGADGEPSCGDDCDDDRSGAHPGATEVCNERDEDCDGEVDEGVTVTFYRDVDGDGTGDPDMTLVACTAPDGYVLKGTDCNDADADVHPGAEELCDGTVDDDCDGTVDEDCPCSAGETRECGEPDGSGGFLTTGACETGTQTCDEDGMWSVCDGAVLPMDESCNDADDDCDGSTDEGGVTTTCYRDMDEDSFAPSGAETMEACSCSTGWTATAPTGSNADCDDGDMSIHPGATEECDGTDSDCDGVVEDEDGDGHVASSHPCSGGSLPKDDCYDLNADAFPGQTSYFATDRGDGSFDYDCNGDAEQRWTDMGFCDGTIGCTLTEGWAETTIPACGVDGDFVGRCDTSCSPQITVKTQECR